MSWRSIYPCFEQVSKTKLLCPLSSHTALQPRDQDCHTALIESWVFPSYMYNYIHFSGNMSENCLSLCNVMHASVITHDVVSVCSYGPNGLQMVCKSLIRAVLRGILCQCNIIVIERGGTIRACTCIVRYDWLWTYCHVYISSQGEGIVITWTVAMWSY